jgi:hypothetical protein
VAQPRLDAKRRTARTADRFRGAVKGFLWTMEGEGHMRLDFRILYFVSAR